MKSIFDGLTDYTILTTCNQELEIRRRHPPEFCASNSKATMWKKVIFWSQETQTPAWPKPWLWVKCENRSKVWVDYLLHHRQCWQWKLFFNYYYFVNYLLNYLLSSSSNMSSISFSHSAFSSLSTTSKSWIDKKQNKY